MREIYEFRIPEAWACEWLDVQDGKRGSTGSVRIVTTPKDSDLFKRVMSAEIERRRTGDRFFLEKVTISPPTLTGSGPVEFGSIDARDYSENIGLNVLSEVSINYESWDGCDFAASKQTVGARTGLLRPRRLLFISRRVLLALSPRMKRGLGFEIVRFA